MDLEKYEDNIGIERLRYHFSPDGTIDEELLVKRYIWNIKVSQALYPILSIAEVYLRNSIDVMLQKTVGKDWLKNEIEKQHVLLDYDYAKLKDAIKTLDKKYGMENVTRGKIIAELNFGFWVNLCSKKYNPKIWTKKNTFKTVFPRFPKTERENIAIISQKLIKIKNLRNRIFHYEPILKSDNDFYGIYNEINEVLSYLPEGNKKILSETDNFKDIVGEITAEISDELSKLQTKNPEHFA